MSPDVLRHLARQSEEYGRDFDYELWLDERERQMDLDEWMRREEHREKEEERDRD